MAAISNIHVNIWFGDYNKENISLTDALNIAENDANVFAVEYNKQAKGGWALFTSHNWSKPFASCN